MRDNKIENTSLREETLSSLTGLLFSFSLPFYFFDRRPAFPLPTFCLTKDRGVGDKEGGQGQGKGLGIALAKQKGGDILPLAWPGLGYCPSHKREGQICFTCLVVRLVIGVIGAIIRMGNILFLYYKPDQPCLASLSFIQTGKPHQLAA